MPILTKDGSVLSNVLKMIFRPVKARTSLNIRLTLIALRMDVIEASLSKLSSYLTIKPMMAPITMKKSKRFQLSLKYSFLSAICLSIISRVKTKVKKRLRDSRMLL